MMVLMKNVIVIATLTRKRTIVTCSQDREGEVLALVHTGEAGPPGCQQLYEDNIDEGYFDNILQGEVGRSLIAFQY